MSGELRRSRRASDALTATMSRALRLGPRRNAITIDRGLRVPMRDGTILIADHYAPLTAAARPTVLMRCPYGRGPQFAFPAWALAERGYHVLLQSSRGTFGSGGRFQPAVDEAGDGQDTVAWLRGQPWFSSRLALVGQSYLAFAAWALATDPPPELTAMALFISPHDLADAGFGRGPFELYNLLSWSDLVANQERLGLVRNAWRTVTAERRLAVAMSQLPIDATGAGLDGGAPWYSEWLTHPDRSDPYWEPFSAAAALDRVAVPTLLVSGFHDFFVEQTVAQYERLRDRGVTTALTIGPWAHMSFDVAVALRQAIPWLDAFADGNASSPPPRTSPVRVWTSGAGRWRDLPDWPLADATPVTWYLLGAGGLADSPGPPCNGSVHEQISAATTPFRYNPADPTPAIGGRVMSVRNGGSRDNSAIEARADVLTFSTAALAEPVEVAGTPRVELYLSSDNPYCDIFVRLCDVDPRGRSRNLTDQIVRCSPASVTPEEVRLMAVELTGVSHVFRPGHRIRLQVSGGAHPRFARNLGTDADLLHGTRTAPVTHHI
ncbi:MAG: CocE/NonD family hydrolase, partial [Actinobacteria bacterium]|nr:CocE/NonD family hydrolase [Actinomycetota bacterium]